MIQDGIVSFDDAMKFVHKFEKAIKIVNVYFPLAKTPTYIMEKVNQILGRYGSTPENTLYAQSVCPDEVNHQSLDITTVLQKGLGEVFHLGGLAGLPFTGKTGFKAFSEHIPDDGNLFIFFSAHTGISDEFEFGKYSRLGQTEATHCCGAACGALTFCTTNPDALRGLGPTFSGTFPGSDPDDFQMDFIKFELSKKMHIINTHTEENARQVETSRQISYIIQERLHRMIDTNFGGHSPNGKLFILGNHLFQIFSFIS